MPVCRENYPFVCSTIKSPDNVPIEFAIENGASVRIVFLNYQSQKHKHQRSRSRQHVFTALLDNVRDHRVRTEIYPLQNHAQAGLRVHRIVIPRFESEVVRKLESRLPRFKVKTVNVKTASHAKNIDRVASNNKR